MPLTDITVKSAKPQDKNYKLSDEKGLFLLINKSGGKYWRFKYRFLEKEKLLSFGVYPEISLKEARDKRDEARKLIREGIDPAQQKKVEKLTRHINSENSFENITREWHEKQKPSWTERYARHVLKRLEDNLFKFIGYKSINEITAPELLASIREIEKRGAIDIAHRVLQTSGQIFRYAIVTGRATHDVSADLKGALQTRKKQHYNSLPEKEFPEFLQKLETYDGEYEGDKQTKLAFKLLINTFVRTVEIRGARWEEFDFVKKEWRIPAERMKMREEHIVPLSKQSLAILAELKPITGHRELLFPNRNKPLTPISENTLIYALYRMGYKGRTTTHGFRSTASTILHENRFPSDIIELQLSHSERNEVKASYNFAKYLPDRHKMMQWWSDYIDRAVKSGGGNVIEGNFGGIK
jgi:integrase